MIANTSVIIPTVPLIAIYPPPFPPSSLIVQRVLMISQLISYTFTLHPDRVEKHDGSNYWTNSQSPAWHTFWNKILTNFHHLSWKASSFFLLPHSLLFSICRLPPYQWPPLKPFFFYVQSIYIIIIRVPIIWLFLYFSWLFLNCQVSSPEKTESSHQYHAYLLFFMERKL